MSEPPPWPKGRREIGERKLRLSLSRELQVLERERKSERSDLEEEQRLRKTIDNDGEREGFWRAI